MPRRAQSDEARARGVAAAKRMFYILNGVAVICVVAAAILALRATSPASAAGIAASLLVVIALILAATSYPFYARFIREEFEARQRARDVPGRSRPRR